MVNGKSEENDGRKVAVLIVEDDPTTARVAKAICESLGCDAYVAHDGGEAMACYEDHALDVIFLDLQMPVMGGFETAYELRQAEEDTDAEPLPIIAVTGTVNADNHIRSIAGGMNACVSKPYTTEMVRGLLERYVEGFRPVESSTSPAYAEGAGGQAI